MTASSFNGPALPYTLREEGGWTVDSGGPTEDGITLTSYRLFAANPDATADELRNISDGERTAFYGMEWNRVRGDDLPAGPDLFVFDAYVNTQSNAAKQLQRVLGLAGTACDGWIGAETIAAVAKVDAGGLALRLQKGGITALQNGLGLKPDGLMGPLTLSAAKAHRDAVIVAALLDQATTFYFSCKQFPLYGAGWLARAHRRAEAAMRLAVPAGLLQAPIS